MLKIKSILNNSLHATYVNLVALRKFFEEAKCLTKLNLMNALDCLERIYNYYSLAYVFSYMNPGI